MNEESIKEAFYKVKEDITALKEAINIISDEIDELKRTLSQTHIPTHKTDRHINQTVPQEIGGLETQNLQVSTGNRGVQTDRQIVQQTDKPIEKFALIPESTPSIDDNLSKIDVVSQILDSLDSVKKELRVKFKRLTQQEMLVFATIYQLEDQGLRPDYKLISSKTRLSESSMRDYVQKIIKKGIPVDKIKENNKKVTLSIPQNLRRMAALDTIIKLREL